MLVKPPGQRVDIIVKESKKYLENNIIRQNAITRVRWIRLINPEIFSY